MRYLLKIISYLGLLLTISPSLLHFYGVIDFEQHKWITLLGTLLYLSSSPFWMNRKKTKAENHI